METRDGRYVLTYNGEIYNYQELKLELSARGHTFNSSGDSEVLLAGSLRSGASHAFLLDFNGMFAFAIWDPTTRALSSRTIVVFAIRFGRSNPVYYCRVFVFGMAFQYRLQKHKAYSVAPSKGYMSRMDVEGLTEYLSFQNFLRTRYCFQVSSFCLPVATCRVDPWRQADRATVPLLGISISKSRKENGRGGGCAG